MSRGLALGLTVGVGGLAALQAVINSQLGKRTGTFQAALISFLVGTLVLVLVAALSKNGLAGVGKARHVPWYYLVGGVLGACYVSCLLVTVRTLGAGGMTATVIGGQLAASVVIDQFGVLGAAKHPIDAARVAGLALLAAGVYLVVRE